MFEVFESFSIVFQGILILDRISTCNRCFVAMR